MKDFNSFGKSQSKIHTDAYVNNLKNGNINNICFLYLGSKAFSDKTKSFLMNRWSTMTDDEIIDDLMSVNIGFIYNEPYFEYDRKYPSLYWICTYNCIDLVPINIIKKLPVSIWNEPILDDHGGNDMSKFEIKTIRDFLLGKRKTPTEVKEYLK